MVRLTESRRFVAESNAVPFSQDFAVQNAFVDNGVVNDLDYSFIIGMDEVITSYYQNLC